jgi:hypothetical protein
MIKYKITPLLIALATFFVVGSASAANWYVDPAGSDSNSCTAPGPATACMTITGAMGKAAAGDTVHVAIGLYNEQVTITKTLTLLGAQAGVDARTRSGSESTIDNACGPVQIEADNVVLDGFTISGSTSSDPCFLSGIWMNPGSNAPDKGGAQILNNIVQNNISGIELDSMCSAGPTLVQHNLIQNNNNPGPGSGNGIQVNFGLCNATIDGNKFSGHTNSSVLVPGVPSSGLTVSNNELVGGTSERIVFGNVTNGAISGNTSIGSTATNGPVRLFGGNSNIAINSNVLKNGIRGIKVDNLFAPNSGVTAHNNCLVGNSVAGLEVPTAGHTGTLDAKNNWWGAASGPKYNGAGPGTGDNIIDADGVVAYIPFLSSTFGTPCAPPPVGPPTSADQCKKDGWKTFNTPRTFKNQGDCIQYVNTGK